MRTPLNAVIGLSELILDSDEINKEFKDKLEKIHTSGITLLGLVNDILDLSKIESGKFEINPVEYYIASLINDVMMLNTMRMEGKLLKFEFFVDERLPEKLFGDDLRIKQVFNNLLSNAFKYTNSGAIEWRVSYKNDGDNIWLVSSVKDSGIGIKPEKIQKLFQEYNQVDVQTNRKNEGTGLGLAITKHLVEMMNGNITVGSEYGKGTTFHINFLQKIVSDTPIGTGMAENLMCSRRVVSQRTNYAKILRANLSYAHVLVVDDLMINLDVAKGMMKPYGIQVDCALSGHEAVNMIRAENLRYDAVFMDHMMPGMDGIEATRIIREEIGTDYARNIPIIALTANAIIGSENMFLSKGFQAFVSKPIDMVKLDSVLRRWIRNKDIEKELIDVYERELSLEDNDYNALEKERATGKSLLSDIIITGLDINRSLSCFDNNENIFIQVLRSYATNTRQLVIKMKEYLVVQNLKDYAIIAHGIKGSSYGVFAQEVGKAAEELEIAAKAGNLEEVKNGQKKIEKNLETLLNNIDLALITIDAFTKKLAAEPDTVLLEELRKACKDYDMNRVNGIIIQLESFKYDHGEKIIKWLREQINDSSFEEIINGEWPSE
jgi:CheY-like chemotaxis protein